MLRVSRDVRSLSVIPVQTVRNFGGSRVAGQQLTVRCGLPVEALLTHLSLSCLVCRPHGPEPQLVRHVPLP